MASKDGESSFRINIDGNAAQVSKDISASARLAAGAIGEFENEAKVLSAELRRLKGNSDEVNATKAALKKRIDEAKTSASLLTVELAKQGTTYTAAAAAAKKYGDGVGKLPNLKKAITSAFAPVGKALSGPAAKTAKAFEPMKKRIGALIAPLVKVGKAAKEDLGGVLPSLGSVLGVVASGAALAGAAMAAVGVAAVGAGVAVAAFGIASAAAASKMQLQREALLGNAKDAKALGEQIAVLAGKVPQGVEELNALSVELSKTRLSGKAIVSTMAAVAQATGAVDASAGSKIQELITRGQQSGRFFLQQLELQGTGLDFDDVAKAYAEGTKKSLAAARKELMTGQVPLEQGAEALKKATEKKFGDINLKQAFSLENGPKKLKEQLAVLSSGVDLSPISKGLQEAFGQLQENAPLGAAIKNFMSTFGQGLVDIAGKSIPVLIEGFKWMLVWALKLGTAYYETKKQIKDAFAEENWVGLGEALIKGLIGGILKSNGVLFQAIKDVGTRVKDAFANELKIHSPSKVFEGFGRNTTEGYAQGVEKGSQRAAGAVQGMAQGLPAPAAGPAASSGGEHIEVHIHGAPTGDAQAMSSPAFLALLTRAIRDARTQRGLSIRVASPAVAV